MEFDADDPVWKTAAATVGSYGLVFLVLFVLLFLVPFALFVVLG